jgi:CheY-like chemotaxis protein
METSLTEQEFISPPQMINKSKIKVSLTPEEKFFYSYIKESNIELIIPVFSDFSIKYPNLSEMETYYTEEDMRFLMESLSRKKVITRINLGQVYHCPECCSPRVIISQFCEKCGSTRINKIEYIKHTECGYTNKKREFIKDHHFICPECENPIENNNHQIKKMYQCETCGKKVINVKTILHCIKCKTKFRPSDAIELNPIGYQITDTDIDIAWLHEIKKLRSQTQNIPQFRNSSDILETTIDFIDDFEKDKHQKNKIKILLLEKEKVHADLIKRSLTLENSDYLIQHVTNANQALKKLRKLYDFIIIDMDNKVEEVKFILKELRKWKICTPVVVFREHRNDLVENELKEFGVKHFMKKTIESYKALPRKLSECEANI